MLHKQINDLVQNDIELEKILCIFALQVFLKPWLTACNAPFVPRTDLAFLGQLRKYHHSVGRVAAAKLVSHLWYLLPELGLLALFDDLVSPNTKRSTVQAMQKKEEHKPRKVKATLKNLLHQLHLDNSFLEKDPELWQQSEAFLHFKDHDSKSSHCQRSCGERSFSESGLQLPTHSL